MGDEPTIGYEDVAAVVMVGVTITRWCADVGDEYSSPLSPPSTIRCARWRISARHSSNDSSADGDCCRCVGGGETDERGGDSTGGRSKSPEVSVLVLLLLLIIVGFIDE